MLDVLTPSKGIPQSEESERAVLAAVLLDPRLLAAVTGRLRPEDFFGERHRAIFAAMIELQDEGSAIDLRTLQARLEQRAQLESVGGLAYLSGLELDLPEIGRFDVYVEIVKERSVRRRLIDVCREVTRDCLDGGLDAAAALGRAEQAVLALGEEAIRRGFVPLSRILEETLEMLEDSPGKGLTGVSSGYLDLDAKSHGLGRGALIIVAGRPGMGKTTFAMNVAQHVAIREQKTVGVFSLEMGQQELALRILAAESEVRFNKLRSGLYSQSEAINLMDTMKKISRSPLFIDDSASPTILEIASKARRLKAEKNLTLLVVDYLQLMQAGGRYENRNLEISAITRSFKQLAKELDIPVVLLSQLSRQPERRGGDHRPQLADLRESGAIEQDADMVLFVYRDIVYNDAADPREAELIIAKNRNGETGSVPLVFFGEQSRFLSRAAPGHHEAPFA
ncbi:MAG: replicative DNA helicase [Thermoanaerobaculia bacterium]|nr:MAG: replicative DNA helicase [Thermoanaerobaculia bacterium]MBZ0100666.1 replicative DNA helicase [Thermoanaerobaculia bacterium]